MQLYHGSMSLFRGLAISRGWAKGGGALWRNIISGYDCSVCSIRCDTRWEARSVCWRRSIDGCVKLGIVSTCDLGRQIARCKADESSDDGVPLCIIVVGDIESWYWAVSKLIWAGTRLCQSIPPQALEPAPLPWIPRSWGKKASCMDPAPLFLLLSVLSAANNSETTWQSRGNDDSLRGTSLPRCAVVLLSEGGAALAGYWQSRSLMVHLAQAGLPLSHLVFVFTQELHDRMRVTLPP